MINFNYETDFKLDNEEAIADWLSESYYFGKQERRRDQLHLL